MVAGVTLVLPGLLLVLHRHSSALLEFLNSGGLPPFLYSAVSLVLTHRSWPHNAEAKAPQLSVLLMSTGLAILEQLDSSPRS